MSDNPSDTNKTAASQFKALGEFMQALPLRTAFKLKLTYYSARSKLKKLIPVRSPDNYSDD